MWQPLPRPPQLFSAPFNSSHSSSQLFSSFSSFPTSAKLLSPLRSSSQLLSSLPSSSQFFSALHSCSHLFFTPSHMFSILRNSPQLISPLLNSSHLFQPFLMFLHTFSHVSSHLFLTSSKLLPPPLNSSNLHKFGNCWWQQKTAAQKPGPAPKRQKCEAVV
jgi:hypothetical protein